MRDALYLPVQNKQVLEEYVAFVPELFYFLYFHGIAQQMSRYLLFLSLLPHKNCSEDAKTFLPSSATSGIFRHIYLAVNIILITNSISNSEQLIKISVINRIAIILNNFGKKPVGILPSWMLAT